TTPPPSPTLSLHDALPICQNLRVPAVAVRDLEKSGVGKPPHQLEADDAFVERLHRIEVVHAERNLAQRFDLAGRHDVVHEPPVRSEEHTSELQSRSDLVCR